MKKTFLFFAMAAIAGLISSSFSNNDNLGFYFDCYNSKMNLCKTAQLELLETIDHANINTAEGLEKIKQQIQLSRETMKAVDFWTRYLEPVAYKKMNGPLPVEWETEVFEKFEKPYKRKGAGLSLAEIYLEEKDLKKDSLLELIKASINASETYTADSITTNLKNFSTFYLCNRLYLLNLAAIYTTGFECPDTGRIIPELLFTMNNVNDIYTAYDHSFSTTALTDKYLSLYREAIAFVKQQPLQYSRFDHFGFIRNYVNPLFTINQLLINTYKVSSRSSMDYSLTKTASSIFSKQLYEGQNIKGIFLRVDNEKALAELERAGKLLFYDPVLSANNRRSCNSCHKSTEYFTDTSVATSLQLDRVNILARNTPSLINTNFNHLLMLDGKHISLQNQAKAVITGPTELGSDENAVLKKILSCNEYKKIFTDLLKYTPQETEITFDHIVSALTYYYARFSSYDAPFDNAMNRSGELNAGAKRGFNLFMSKAQCATCHFVPQFNGVKPPYISSEFEVLGVPDDTGFVKLNKDEGRYMINPAEETMNAFRTGSLRNCDHTMPYMHNGVFKTMKQVIDFYDAGGGAGRGLKVPNQTLSADSLKLTPAEKKDLLLFISSLNEKIEFDNPPLKLPLSSDKKLNTRKVGGDY